MDFSYDMFVDLAQKSGFLLAYGVIVIVVWMLAEKVFGFNR